MDNAARTQAIEYRRQLLRIVDQIERDYKLGKYAEDAPVFLEVDAIGERPDSQGHTVVRIKSGYGKGPFC